MHCQRLVLVGDAHLGRESAVAEAAFLDFLDAVPGLGDGLVITGDLFEFWFAYGRTVPSRGLPVVAALGHLARRMPILMAGGNHDRWGGRVWQDQFGIEFCPMEGEFAVGGRRGVIRHGDGLTETHWSASVLHHLLRHDATIALFRAVHPDLGLWLVDRLSAWLGDRERTEAEISASAARQEEWARRRMAADPGLSLLVMGHTHRAQTFRLEDGRLYVNPGAWFDRYRYAIVADGHAELRSFTP